MLTARFLSWSGCSRVYDNILKGSPRGKSGCARARFDWADLGEPANWLPASPSPVRPSDDTRVLMAGREGLDRRYSRVYRA